MGYVFNVLSYAAGNSYNILREIPGFKSVLMYAIEASESLN